MMVKPFTIWLSHRWRTSETLKFDIKATPAGETLVANVNFKQQFYTD